MTPRLGSALLPAADALRASLLQDVETPGADAQGGDAERQALVAARDSDPAPPRRLQSGLFDVSGRQTVAQLRQRVERMSHAESCDFALKDTDVEREVRTRRGGSRIASVQTWRLLLVLLIGLAMGALSLLVNLAASALTLLRFRLADTLIQATGALAAPLLAFVGLAAAYGAAAGAVVIFGAPQAAGSGLAEMRAYFNGVHVSGLLTLRTMVAKLVSAVCVLSAGLVAEGESPFVHVGGIVGGALAGLGSRSVAQATKGRWQAELPRRFGGWFRDEAEHRDMIAVGAASGLAVAFVAPLAGVLLIVEQSAANLAEAVYWRALLAAAAAVLALNVLAAAYEEGPGFWDARLLFTFAPSAAPALAAYRVRLWELPAFAAAGALLGAAAALCVAVNVNVVHAARQRWAPPAARFRRLAEVVLLAAATAGLWLGLCYASPCAATPPPARQAALAPAAIPTSLLSFGEYSLYPQLWCPRGEYSVHGQLFFAPTRLTLRRATGVDASSAAGAADADTLFDPRALALYAVATTLMLTATYGAGASLGVVTPTLQVGAVAGLLVCHAVRAAARAAGYAGAPASLPVYGVVGAGAALSGCLRYRATAVLIAVEATGAWSLVLPVVIAVFFAELAADRLSTGLFDAYLHLACMPVLADPVAAPAVAHERLDVSGVMAAGVRALPPVVAVADAAAALADTAFSARPSAFCRRNGTACARRADAGAPRQTFPVTDEPEAAARPGADFCVLGTVERRTLLTLLAHRVGLVAGPGGAARLPADDAGWEALSRALEPRPPGADAAADQAAVLGGLGTGDRRAWLDLRPFMARAPLLVPAGASLTRALLLFRGLGLRHLLVAPEHPRAVGLVTRADLTLENAQLAMATRRPTAACR